MSGAALEVEDLAIAVHAPGRDVVRVVDGVSFAVAPGRSLGIVGESGSGKSLTLRAIMALLPTDVRLEGGAVALGGRTLPPGGRAARRERRGRIGMVFQDALAALSPVHTAGAQIAEGAHRVGGLSRGAARERAIELLRLVGLQDPARAAGAFPHQLSGGMRQRVALAMALAAEPDVLLCDEPTTALDVTVQAQVLELIDDLRRRLGLAVLFVSHDLAVVRQVCDDVAVMYTGKLVETAPTAAVLERPRHPYTLGLLEAVVDLDDGARLPVAIPGALPEPGALPPGCPFHPRCALRTPECEAGAVPLRPFAGDPWPRTVACLHAEEVPVP